MSPTERKAMIRKYRTDLSVTKQCTQLVFTAHPADFSAYRLICADVPHKILQQLNGSKMR
jgi:hypothetical protein